MTSLYYFRIFLFNKEEYSGGIGQPNLRVKNVSFMTRCANGSEVRDGKAESRNTADYLEKGSNKSHSWLLHFPISGGHFCLDASLIPKFHMPQTCFFNLDTHTHLSLLGCPLSKS